MTSFPDAGDLYSTSDKRLKKNTNACIVYLLLFESAVVRTCKPLVMKMSQKNVLDGPLTIFRGILEAKDKVASLVAKRRHRKVLTQLCNETLTPSQTVARSLERRGRFCVLHS